MDTRTNNLSSVFTRFPSQFGKLISHRGTDYVTSVVGWNQATPFVEENSDRVTLFGYVVVGETTVKTATSTYHLIAGQYFSIATPCSVQGGEGMIVRHTNFKPLSIVGGPIEAEGRLQYISGCTDTLLIPPPRHGDPCFNALYFPPETNQQPHTHPSIRVGVVARGCGEAVLSDRVEPLNTGDIFVILPDGLHSFRTSINQQMTVIAYHPDSDFGPEDDHHPMINRTLINGVSAGRGDTKLTATPSVVSREWNDS
ncbi:MAG: hypothetical protein COA78_36010 [Blastopirellula sp.]|nr:MAG: hypothetical protein COA78_36010 [Blastopirellula sp.]